MSVQPPLGGGGVGGGGGRGAVRCGAGGWAVPGLRRGHCGGGDPGGETSQQPRGGGSGVAFGDEGAVAAAGVGAGQAGDSRQLAGHGHAGAVEEAARDLAQRGLRTHAPAERVRKPADAQRPDVGELRLVVDLARHHEHRRLELVHRPVNVWRSVTPESARRSLVLISHSRRSTRRIACA